MEKFKKCAETIICHPVGVVLFTLVFIYAGKFLSMFLYRILERAGIEVGLSADITSILMAVLVLIVYLKRIRGKDGAGKHLGGRHGSLTGKKRKALKTIGAVAALLVSLGVVLLSQAQNLFTIGWCFRLSFHPIPGRILHYVWSALITAVWEEMLFRGIVVSAFFSRLGEKEVWTAAIVSSFVFALGHSLFNPVQIISAFTFGMLSFAAFFATDRLWSGMLLHFVTNFIGWIAEDGLTDEYAYRTMRIISEGDFQKLYNRFHFVTYAQVWYFLRLVIFVTAVCIIFVYVLLSAKERQGWRGIRESGCRGESIYNGENIYRGQERMQMEGKWENGDTIDIFRLNLYIGIRRGRVCGYLILSVLLGIFYVFMAWLNTEGFTRNLRSAYFVWPGEFSPYLFALLAMVPEVFIGEEFMQRTLNNPMAAGISRKNLFWGKYLYLAAVVLSGAGLNAITYAAGVKWYSMILKKPVKFWGAVTMGQYLIWLLLVFSVFLAVLSVAFCLCILCRSQLKAALAGIVLVYSEVLYSGLSKMAGVTEITFLTSYLPVHLVRNLTAYVVQGRMVYCEYLGYFLVVILGTAVLMMTGFEAFKKRDFR